MAKIITGFDSETNEALEIMAVDENSELVSFPSPIVSSISPSKISHNTTTDVIISGSYFTNDTSVSIEGQTVNSFAVNSHDEIVANITTNDADGLYDVTISNGNETICSDLLQIELSIWIDLREGGQTFSDGNEAGNDIRYRSGMSLVRDSNGINFNGANPWKSWAKFESLGWTRGDNLTLEWVMTNPTSAMMIGIGSDESDENNTAQYRQLETLAYFQNSTTMWGLYGNNSNPGSNGSQNNSTNVSGYQGIKVKFEGDGSKDSQFTVYGLSNINNWDDESNEIKTFVIGGTLNPDSQNLFPAVIPRPGNQRLVAIKQS